ncbi:peroxiredoxin-like family protein [Pseudofrankia asymbiotica]|uniref:thioredoxin-dependent peroxiredoxin n=1 Tax=Pseudofrankia asymbiotica TaxID=1834516 RepID=A0A1V2I4R9_9ACTN|nr:peroxiredoxin-like family protein [Pseudofrankia asymbiotica]ONH25134.1 hypothetical protein BL253_28410 [Pseudofrankia asymbiotica]
MQIAHTATTSLTNATVALREQLRDQLGEVLDPFDADAERLAALRLAAVPAVGTTAPAFVLPDVHGEQRALSALVADGPVVIVFYRGAWCPYCNLQLNAFKDRHDDIREAGGTLVAISPQTPDNSLSFAERQQLPFIVLSDVHNAVARSYGLVIRQGDEPTAIQRRLGIDLEQINGDDSQELPAAATFVLDQTGVIRFASVSSDYRWRVGPDEVVAALRDLH